MTARRECRGRSSAACVVNQQAPLEPVELPSPGELELVHAQLEALLWHARPEGFFGRREVPRA